MQAGLGGFGIVGQGCAVRVGAIEKVGVGVDDDGAFVSTTDMDPCVSKDSASCERFPAAGPYMSAIEVFRGDLASVGIVSGSTAVIVPGTESATCPTTL